MTSPRKPAPAPAFTRALEDLSAIRWRRGLEVEEIGSPQRIAPHSVALSADLQEDEESIATGRLILLHDPDGNDAWEGTFRIVSYVHARVDLEMVADPLLPDVAWSWMLDSLASHHAAHRCAAGTVTASYGRTYGEMQDEEDRAEVEVRSSWTPEGIEESGLLPHLVAWQDLLGLVAGRPPLPAGVVAFPGRP